jgi:3-oxoacyl-[acyl-carrier protein] reductase
MDDYDFSGKVVLVTGSSRGIGAGMITAFGQRGSQCAVTYVTDAEGRNKADAERIAGGLRGARIVQCDVADAEPSLGRTHREHLIHNCPTGLFRPG